MGKRMFEAGEQGWPEEAPFHTPVFVVTHEKRDPWERPGGRPSTSSTTASSPARPGPRGRRRPRRPVRGRRHNDLGVRERRPDRRVLDRALYPCCSAPASACSRAWTRAVWRWSRSAGGALLEGDPPHLRSPGAVAASTSGSLPRSAHFALQSCAIFRCRVESRRGSTNGSRVPRWPARLATRCVDRWGAHCRPDDSSDDARWRGDPREHVRPSAQVRGRLFDPRSRDGRGDQHQPHAAAIAGRPAAKADGTDAPLRGNSGSHGPHARLHEHEVLGVRLGTMGVVRREGHQRAGAANIVRYRKHLARNDIALTHTIIQPTIDKRTDCQVHRQPGQPPQSRRDERRHRGQGRPGARHAGAVR